MKKSLIFLYLLLLAIILCSQEPEWLWAQSAGSGMEDCGYDLATDSVGNTYVTGEFRNTITFGSIELTSEGYVDVFIAKADPNGNWLWANCALGTDSERGYGISIDNAGNSYIIGHFQGTASFGNTSITSIDNFDVFIAKADSEGNWLWAKRCGATWGNSIATDEEGSCYITGYFSIVSNGDFGSTMLSSLGNYDIFVAKLDTDGNWLWAVQAGGQDEDYAWGISIDSNGNSYITGYFITSSISHICYFGDIELLSSSGYDSFVAKLGPNGNWLWAVNQNADGHEYSYEISTNSSGVSFIIGEQYGGVYIASIGPNGNWLWTSEINGTAACYGEDVCSDDSGNCYATGYFSGDVELGSITLDGLNSSTDIFVAKLDSNGDWLWAVNNGGSTSDQGYGIAVDLLGNCYITGEFYYTFYCGPFSLPNFGDGDIFVAKLGNDTSIDNEIIPTNLEFSNYPNPFNPKTSINFSIQKDSNVELTIYNIKGRKIKTILNQTLKKGKHSFIWSGTDKEGTSVSSGIYFLKLIVNNETELTKRCLLLK